VDTSTQRQWLGLARRAHHAFRDCQGVLNVGFGFAVRRGRLTDELSLIVKVSRKLAPAELKSAERIPACFEGARTDVVEDRSGPLAGPKDRFQPLMGGIQIQSAAGTGTLGCVVFDTAGARPFGLTARHVVVRPADPQALTVAQPGFDAADPVIGAGDRTDSVLDLARIRFDGSRRLSTGILDLVPASSRGITSPLLGMRVSKAGAATGLTHGIIQFVGFNAVAFDVVPDRMRMPWPLAFAAPGDSGSVVTDSAHGRCVGLLIRGPQIPGEISADSPGGAVAMAQVARALEVFVYDGASGIWVRHPARIGGGGLAFAAVLPNTDATLRIVYPSGRISTAKGLGKRRSDPDGFVRWTWVVGTHTTHRPGRLARALLTVGSETREMSFALTGNPRRN